MEPFLRMAAKAERALTRLAVALLSLLVLGQIMIADDSGRWLMTFVNPTEGVPEAVPATTRTAALQMTLTLEGRAAAPDVSVLVNGVRVAAFYSAGIVIGVNPGDEVSVDARCCRQPLSIRVRHVSPGVIFPVDGYLVRTSGDVVTLGRVRWRRLP